MKATQNVQLVSRQVLEALTKPKLTDNDRAKIIAEGFAQIEKNQFDFDNLATKSDIKETELRLTSNNKNLELKLTKEIEAIRLETKNLEVKLIKEIESVRKETKNLEVKLTKEINNQKVEVTKEISQSSKNTIMWTTGLIITMMIAIVSIILMK